MPCERLFSAGKEIAVARRSQLGADLFEQLQILKSAWKKSVFDEAAYNTNCAEEIDMDEYREMLIADGEDQGFDSDVDEVVEA